RGVAPSRERQPEHTLGLAVHRRRVEKGRARLERAIDDRPGVGFRRLPFHVERAPRAHADDGHGEDGVSERALLHAAAIVLYMRVMILVASLALLLTGSARAQDIPADYKEFLHTVGKTGDYKGGVLKVNLPRGDMKVTIAGRPAPTPFGFGVWVALTKG